MIAKKPTKKVVKKSSAKKTVKKAKKIDEVQDLSYWQSRPLTDKDRDWGYGKDTWLDDYVASIDHPHRAKIIELLKTFEWSYLFEVGCATGPNLALIRENFPDKALFGVEPNEDAVTKAHMTLASNIEVQVGSYYELPYKADTFDVVLADASLMYCSPKDIGDVMDELDRVTSKAILIVDRFTEKDSTESHVWSRNYGKLLKDRGYQVLELAVTESDWGTSKNWVKYGKYWLGTK